MKLDSLGQVFHKRECDPFVSLVKNKESQKSKKLKKNIDFEGATRMTGAPANLLQVAFLGGVAAPACSD